MVSAESLFRVDKNMANNVNVVDVTTPPHSHVANEASPSHERGKAALGQKSQGKRVWIDIDNSPHVPFFLPIIDELRDRGIEVVLTARDIYQVCDLLEFYKLPCQVIGRHYGKNKALKVLGNCMRALQLIPPTWSSRPDLALSHGSRAQILVCKALGIPSVMMHDYEHSTKTGFLTPNWVFMPDVIPSPAMGGNEDTILKYPGIKEDVYVPRFRPDSSVLGQLGIAEDDLVVTLRPPATEAHYHNPESEILFAETVRMLAEQSHVRAVTLPRNARQGEQLRQEWADVIAAGKMIIPARPVDGLNIIWFSDLVISGGGTMNREAAALGVPVYSIFRGKIGAVDQYLEKSGRLTLIESVREVRQKIALKRRDRVSQPDWGERPTLRFIVDNIATILEEKCPATQPSAR
jgi:predicted glycosyltransferase